MTSIREHRITDILRNREDPVTVRFNAEDTKTLASEWNYSGDDKPRAGYTAELLRKVEVLEYGEWKPYPSVSRIAEDGGDKPYTVALVRLRDGSIGIMESPAGMPDRKLMLEAEKAGILTQTIA